ncbi:Uncharacterized protein Rs2_51577 [Raphanus sativus]|nr:Uncharacterized protein Rs2_51577 [Raphanus sativus]
MSVFNYLFYLPFTLFLNLSPQIKSQQFLNLNGLSIDSIGRSREANISHAHSEYPSAKTFFQAARKSLLLIISLSKPLSHSTFDDLCPGRSAHMIVGRLLPFLDSQSIRKDGGIIFLLQNETSLFNSENPSFLTRPRSFNPFWRCC